MKRKYLQIPFEVKAVKADGIFEGIASPFGEIDSQRDIVMPGAFTKTLAQFKNSGRKVPMLWQHKSDMPIGVYQDLVETETGLMATGECNMQVQQGAECHSLMGQGALSGLSIGYDTVRDEFDSKLMVRKLYEINLWEISPVTFPSADSARVSLVKTLDETNNLSDCEQILRDAGFSKSEATAFTSRVKAIAMRSDSADGFGQAVSRITKLLTS